MNPKNKTKNKEFESVVQGISSVKSAIAAEDIQWRKYINKKVGHGFSAEDANAINERLRFKKVDKAGTNNEKNGPDRISDGIPIQTKYFNSAKGSVDAAFSGDDGQFKYENQVLEVPKEQYYQAVEIMKDKIKQGKLPGVTDTEKASDIIKKGGVTYKQARNIARAGNIDSVWFDMKTQMVASTYAFGISFAVEYTRGVQSGLKQKDAIKVAIGTALKSGSTSMIVGVLTQQILRTTSGRVFATITTKFSRNIVNGIYKTGAGKKAVEKLASTIFKKALHGVAAKNAVSKILRTNTVTATVTTMVLTLPDFFKALVDKSISWTQFSKNLTVNVAGVGGGAVGAIAGAAAGSFFPIPGNVIGGIIGGICGGVGSSMGTKKIADLIVEDDAKQMVGLMNESVSDLAYDYLITEKEFEETERRSRDGIPLDPKVAADLRRVAEELQVAYDLE